MENARMSNAAALVTELWKTEYARGRQLIGNASSTCDGVMVNGVCETVDRKRRSNDDNDCKKWVNGRCIDPSSSRKRRATPTPDDELCVIDEDNDDSDDVC